MNSIESAILDLLEASSLPGIYKLMIKNLMGQMSREQKEELLKILFADQNNMQEIKKKKMAIYRKYEPLFDSMLEDLDQGKDVTLNPMILSFFKTDQEQKKTEKTNLKLDALKSSIPGIKN